MGLGVWLVQYDERMQSQHLLRRGLGWIVRWPGVKR
jgi:hypothetical protein